MRTIILTGVNRGLGKAIHELLSLDEFASDEKIFTSRNVSGLSNKLIAATYFDLDLSIKNIDFNKIRIDYNSSCLIFINNAGTLEPIGLAEKVSTINLEDSFRINCLTPLILARYLTSISKVAGIPLFVINISSGAANRPIKGWLAYCVSKSAAKMAFDVLVAENAHVRVHHFDPGVIDTDMQELIRRQSQVDMPDVLYFKEIKNNNKLKSPLAVAWEVIEIIKRLSL